MHTQVPVLRKLFLEIVMGKKKKKSRKPVRTALFGSISFTSVLLWQNKRPLTEINKKCINTLSRK